MKNSIVFIGIALVSFANVCNAFNGIGKQRESNSIVFEAIDSVKTNKIEKTTDELIAKDNAITGNNISNETQALDFVYINSHSIVEEVVESVNANKTEKTADELIAQDNAITGSNITNETQALDFNVINRNSNLVTANNKTIFGKRQKS
jgi:predicted transcriptional regulator